MMATDDEDEVRKSRTWPDTAAGIGLLLACALLLGLIYAQFRGDFTPKTKLTMLAARAGLVMDDGSKVTYNGVSIGRVAGISEVEHQGKPAAQVHPRRRPGVRRPHSGQRDREDSGDDGVRQQIRRPDFT